SRQFFAESPRTQQAASRGWFTWLKPAFALPAFAALFIVIGYQNLHSIPALKERAAVSTKAAAITPWFSLVNSSVHGSSGTPVNVRPGEGFQLFFHITLPTRSDSVFSLDVQNSAGQSVLSSSVSADRVQQGVILPVSVGLQPGDYK